MRRLGRFGTAGPPGQLDKALLIGLGLLAVVLVRWFAPEPGERLAGPAAQATPTPNRGAGPAGLSPTPIVESTPTPPAARAATPDPPYWRINSGGDGVNMRESPSTNAPIALRLPDQEVVTNLERTQQADGLLWRNVALGNVEGWVAQEFLVPQYD